MHLFLFVIQFLFGDFFTRNQRLQPAPVRLAGRRLSREQEEAEIHNALARFGAQSEGDFWGTVCAFWRRGWEPVAAFFSAICFGFWKRRVSGADQQTDL
ncbi:hypothetical protein Pla8534_24020 [Lignipirellula cremea]|uniref:Uncharacterized protein n=1 Tax=Lignipirellula cremea TaxID=2528010 RepID=A0A518DS00_9BACT|nr:hypothetical protein Pla8534_24020 [Lignipirellula cremea]